MWCLVSAGTAVVAMPAESVSGVSVSNESVSGESVSGESDSNGSVSGGLPPAGSVPTVRGDSRDALLLNLRAGPETALSATDFLRYLERYGGMTTEALSAPVTYHAALKLRRAQWSFGIDAGYCSSYTQFSSIVPVFGRSDPTVALGHRTYDQSVTVESAPLAFCVDYCPSATQFREYVTMGIGATRTVTKWSENVSSTVIGDALKSGTRLDSAHVVPLARVGVGVELCFDNYAGRTAGSLLVEVSYTYAPNIHRPFASIPASDSRFDAVRGASVAMGMSSLRLLVGVQLSSKRTH